MKRVWSSLFFLCAASASACGPFFPATVLDRPDVPLHALTFVFDLSGILPTNSSERAVSERADAELHTDDACRAAYLQGRHALGQDDRQAIAWFRLARQRLRPCARADDGLAAATIGWEARAELNLGNLIRAGELYVEHYASGDPTALMSLRVVAGRILECGGDTLHAAARHPQLSRVVTVYLAARGGPFRPAPPADCATAWLDAVERAGTEDLACADLLAWASYQAGDFARAQRWLVRAPRQSASTAWLRAKLLLRDGNLEGAAATLARAVRQFPQAADWPKATCDSDSDLDCYQEPATAFDRARGELAFLQLRRSDYRETLDLLLRAHYWTDAAHVAERVLSVDELVAFADGVPDERLRHLLARRLARLGRYAEARHYLPEVLRPKLDELAAALQRRDADALWRAAQILRWDGMELIGTELAPDWHLHDGSFAAGFDEEQRLAPATADVQPLLRFHYRYRAAELAWEAAKQMPDNTEATAHVLCTAGTWLKNRDPQAADRFYKALVNRCRQTALGQEADRLRWFPNLPDRAAP